MRVLKILLTTFLFLLATIPAFSADEWDKTRITGTTLINDIDTVTQAQFSSLDRILSNYREGMVLTYVSVSSIGVSAGEIVCSNSLATIRKFRSNPSSTNLTFADIDTGVEASNTTYYVYAVCDADAETATFKISASSTTPTGVTYFKRLGLFTNNSASDIVSFKNDNAKNLGAPVSKSSSTVYQAATDGYVTAYAAAQNSTNISGRLSLSSTMTSADNKAYFESSASGVSGAVIFISYFVPQGYYYTVVSNTFGSTTVYFTPNE